MVAAMDTPELTDERAAAILAAAFQADPMMRFIAPDDRPRARLLEPLFASSVRHARRSGGGVVGFVEAAVTWLPWTRIHLSLWDMLCSGMGVLPFLATPAALLRLARHDDAALAVVAPVAGKGDDVAYLWQIGVDPSCQGKGHGGRLLHQVFEVMAPRFPRCILRTEQERNVPFYEKHGFRCLKREAVAVSQLEVWVFERPLR
jgi:ribosomal protein S18 acetylase RimI-like enzyme